VQLTEKLDQLVEDTKRIFLEKNKDEDLQAASLHASRAAAIARRHNLVQTKEGRSVPTALSPTCLITVDDLAV
jgi:hypothetical protein